MSADERQTRREIPGPRAVPSSAPDTAFDVDRERFQLGEELGRGGMGRVVAATDRALAREVAIKQALTDDETQLARFEREVRITAQLEHPSIIPIHDAGRDKTGRPYYVMRRLDGEQLSDRVAAATSVRERLALVPNVLAAVDAAAFAHARKIIHRDIKPWNILVGAYGETLLIDWGLARELDEPELPASGGSEPGDTALTRAGGVCGTPGYMAPEQARGEPADERADVYALGATLLHVLTGESVLGGSSATAWLAQVGTGGALPTARLPSGVPRELFAVVAKAMEEDRRDRYRDAGELAADLRAFLTGQLVAAHRYTRRERLARFVRRHRIALAIAAVAVVVIAVVAEVSIRNVIEERDLARAAREDAERERATALVERQLATDRAEVMLLERASALTASNPTRAVSLLRQLPSTSPHLSHARDIAATAAARGIARGVVTNLASVNILAFTHDGRTLVAAGQSSDVWAIDVATGNHRVFAVGGRVTAGTMLGDRFVFGAAGRGMLVLDLRSGRVEVIDPEAKPTLIWTSEGDRYRFLDSGRQVVVERSLAQPGARTLATGVHDAMPLGQRVVIDDGESLAVLGGPRPIEVIASRRYTGSPSSAVSVAGDRFAIASPDGVSEWDATGKQTRNWKLPLVLGMIYGDGHQLYASTAAGRIVMLGETVFEVANQKDALLWRTRIPGGAAFVDSGSQLRLFFGRHVMTYPLDHPGSRTLESSPDGRWLAIGSVDGTVRWIDLDVAYPEFHVAPDGTHACWVDDHDVIVLADTRTRALSRKDHTWRDLATISPDVVSCHGRLDNTLVLTASDHAVFVDMDHATSYQLDHFGFVDPLAKRFVFVRDRELVDLVPTPRSEKVLWTAPDKIDVFASRGRWAAAMVHPDMIYRIDRQTNHVLGIRKPAVDMISVDLDGSVAFVQDHMLSVWDGTNATDLIELPPGEVTALFHFDSGWSVQYRDGSLWYATDAGVVQRAPANRLIFVGMYERGVAWRLSMHQRLYRLQVPSGEHLVLDIPLLWLAVAQDELAVGTGVGFVAVIEDTVPRKATQLHAWIDRATNAYLDETSALRWRGERAR